MALRRTVTELVTSPSPLDLAWPLVTPSSRFSNLFLKSRFLLKIPTIYNSTQRFAIVENRTMEHIWLFTESWTMEPV